MLKQIGLTQAMQLMGMGVQVKCLAPGTSDCDWTYMQPYILNDYLKGMVFFVEEGFALAVKKLDGKGPSVTQMIWDAMNNDSYVKEPPGNAMNGGSYGKEPSGNSMNGEPYEKGPSGDVTNRKPYDKEPVSQFPDEDPAEQVMVDSAKEASADSPKVDPAEQVVTESTKADLIEKAPEPKPSKLISEAEHKRISKYKKKELDVGKVKALHDAGWSLPKIADEMGVSVPTIRTRLREMGVLKTGTESK